MKKIFITEYYDVTEAKNFDKIILLENFYLHNDPKIIKFDLNYLIKNGNLL